MEGVGALGRRGGPAEDEVVDVVPDKSDAPHVHHPLEGVGDGGKNLRGLPKAKGEHRVHVDGILPLNAQQGAVLGMNWDDPIRCLNVQLRDEGPGAQSGRYSGNLVNGDVAQGTEERVDTVVHALTFGRGKVSYEPPSSRGVAFGNDTKLVHMHVWGRSAGERAEEATEGDFLGDVVCHDLWVCPCRWAVAHCSV